MTTPVTRYLKKEVPTPSKHAWYQSALVRRVILCSTAALSALAAKATLYTYHSTTASSWTVGILAGFATALTISSLVNLILPTSEKDPAYRARLRNEALAVIEPDQGPIMSYPEIQRRFSSLFDEGILVDGDVCALLRKECEIHKLTFEEICNNHTDAVLDRIKNEPTIVQALADKYLESETAKLPLHRQTDVWIKGLVVAQDKLASVSLSANEATITATTYLFANFETQYGLDVLRHASLALKQTLYGKLTLQVQGLTVREYQRKYEGIVITIYGEAAHNALIEVVVKSQVNLLTYHHVKSYEGFRIGNGPDIIEKVAKSDPQAKAKLKELYLRMDKRFLLSDVYENERACLEIGVDECLQGLNDWAEGVTWLRFKQVVGLKHFDKLSASLQIKFKNVIFQILVGNPTCQADYVAEMEKFGFTNDQIYLARWKDKRLFNDVYNKDGKEFPTLLQDPKVIKERVLKETANWDLRMLMFYCPEVFKRVFEPDDRAAPEAITIKERFQGSVQDYHNLSQAALAYGKEFYTAGFLSSSHIEKLVAQFLFERPNLNFDKNNESVPAPVVFAIVKRFRLKVEEMELRYQREKDEIEVAHRTDLEQIQKSTQTQLDQSEEFHALELAREKERLSIAQFEASDKEFKELRKRSEELSKNDTTNLLATTALRRELNEAEKFPSSPLQELEKRKQHVSSELEQVRNQYTATEKELHQKIESCPDLPHKVKERNDIDTQLKILRAQEKYQAAVAQLTHPHCWPKGQTIVGYIRQAPNYSRDIAINLPSVEDCQKILLELENMGNPSLNSLPSAELVLKKEQLESIISRELGPLQTKVNEQKTQITQHEEHLKTLDRLMEGHANLNKLRSKLQELEKQSTELLRAREEIQPHEAKCQALFKQSKAAKDSVGQVVQQARENYEALRTAKERELEPKLKAMTAQLEKSVSDLFTTFTANQKQHLEIFKGELKTLIGTLL